MKQKQTSVKSNGTPCSTNSFRTSTWPSFAACRNRTFNAGEAISAGVSIKVLLITASQSLKKCITGAGMLVQETEEVFKLHGN
jgi:hypothetical protein